MKLPPDGIHLVDVLAGEGEAFDVSFLERNQHPLNVCHGPDLGRLCPLLGHDGCAVYESAHGVVFELVERFRERKPDIPNCVVVRADFDGFAAGIEAADHYAQATRSKTDQSGGAT